MPGTGELTEEPAFYRAVHRLAEAAWERNMTVQALLALAELLDGRPPTGENVPTCNASP